MDTATIRNAIIVQMKADTALTAEVAAAKIDYGMPSNIQDTVHLPRSIRLVQLGRGEEEIGEFSAGKQWVWVPYRFHALAIIGMESDETDKDAEDAESTIDKLMRQAITKDRTLGGVVVKAEVGRTFFLVHPERKNVRMLVMEVGAITHEQSDAR